MPSEPPDDPHTASSDPDLVITTAGVTVVARGYRWAWERSTDVFELTDSQGRTMTSARLQPAVLVHTISGEARCAPGEVVSVTEAESDLTISYGGVNLTASLTVRMVFHQDVWMLDPVLYEAGQDHEVVSVHYFVDAAGGDRGDRLRPGLKMTYLVHPGLCMFPGLGPVVDTQMGLQLTSWLGRGSLGDTQLAQQWGLPVHYFAGVSRLADHNERDSRGSGQSDAFCCGLTSLPDSDMLLDLGRGAVSPTFVMRSDLWHHRGRSVRLSIGASLLFAFGSDYRSASRAYYSHVAGPQPSVRATRGRLAETLRASQFNTWGAQCAGGTASGRFDQKSLLHIYDAMRQTHLRPGMFVIDDKWEGNYGQLEHDHDRFPDFEATLARIRADGHRIGLWAAFLRTSDPQALGLRDEHLMHGTDGEVIRRRTIFAPEPYALLDPSHPQVERVLARLIKRFVERYRPDLVKFDFGYELPSLSRSCPHDPAYSGERLLGKALEVVVGALRAADPDIAVMYYSLSPLMLPFVDQHSHDDLYLAVDEYDLESQRRGYFSSHLAELGVSVYPSGGYDWGTAAQLWREAAVHGPIGSLNGFDGDEHGGLPDPSAIAQFNGLTKLTRPPSPCTLEPLAPPSLGGIRGARSSSWLRYEDGDLVAATIRPEHNDSLPGDAPIRVVGDVVVSALDGGPLRSAERLGLVTPGACRLELRHDTAAGATAVGHRLDGTSHTVALDHRNGHFAVTISAQDSGAPTEWTEIRFVAETSEPAAISSPRERT